MFNFLLAQCQFVYLRVFLTKILFSVVYCRVFLSLSCIVVYYPINYRVCSFVYWNTRYTLHDTRYTNISCIKSETLITTVPPEAACGRSAADYERRHAFLVFITNAADARPTLRPTHCGRRMRPTHAAAASEWSLRSLAKSAVCGRRSGRRMMRS